MKQHTALNGGLPTMSSNTSTPRAHTSTLVPYTRSNLSLPCSWLRLRGQTTTSGACIAWNVWSWLKNVWSSLAINLTLRCYSSDKLPLCWQFRHWWCFYTMQLWNVIGQSRISISCSFWGFGMLCEWDLCHSQCRSMRTSGQHKVSKIFFVVGKGAWCQGWARLVSTREQLVGCKHWNR